MTLTQREDLPHENAKGPHVTLSRVDLVKYGLGSHPLEWQSSLWPNIKIRSENTFPPTFARLTYQHQPWLFPNICKKSDSLDSATPNSVLKAQLNKQNCAAFPESRLFISPFINGKKTFEQAKWLSNSFMATYISFANIIGVFVDVSGEPKVTDLHNVILRQ